MKSKKTVLGLLVAAGVVAFGGAAVYAANQTQLEQIITAGTLTTDVVDGSGNPVASPQISLPTVSASPAQQTTNATYPSGTDRVVVTNPGGANNGWNLTIAATDGPTALWQRTTAGASFDYNGTAAEGQLTIDAAAATLSNPATGITQPGAPVAFAQGTVDSITLLSASNAAPGVWQGYLTGIGIQQTIPAGQAPGTYRINLTQTVTAL